MKKGVLLLIFFSIFLMSFVIAEDTTKDLGYKCLKQKFIDKGDCGGLSPEERILSLSTLGKCSEQVISDFDANHFNNSLKLSARAAMALKKVGLNSNATAITDWIRLQNQTDTSMTWYLQIDSTDVTSCTVNYEGGTNTVAIAADKKITLTPNQGPCLTTPTNDIHKDYWPKITSTCYSKKFEITCGAATDTALSFKTNLLFKKLSGTTIYVSPTTHTGSGGATTDEKINFLCFKDSTGSCDYEGSLWANLALTKINPTSNSDLIAPVNSYLTTFYKDPTNQNYLPEAFLSHLITGGNFVSELIGRLTSPNPYWLAYSSSNKYYDTALALSSGFTVYTEYTNAIAWLKEEQVTSGDKIGCWNTDPTTSFVDTAFILESAWTKDVVRIYPSCSFDNECNLNEKCTRGTCKPICDETTNCLPSSGKSCASDNTCRECSGEDDCSDVQHCDIIIDGANDWTCQPDCTLNGDCTAGSKNICHNSVCKECSSISNCNTGEYCSTNTWTCETGCMDKDDCSSEKFCEDSQCKECTTNANCTTTGETCDTSTWTCQPECTSKDDCTSGYCENSVCVGCSSSVPCETGYNCVDSKCKLASSEDGLDDCIGEGYFCMAGINCQGSILDAYECSGWNNCCSKEQVLETCSDLNGDICNSNQKCAGGDSRNTFDLDYGQICCIKGVCEEKTSTAEEFTCESSGGICRINGCETNEETSYDTCEFNDDCCVTKTTSAESNYLWVWVLLFLVLIALVGVGIVKRDKLREYWFRLKSKFKKNPPLPPGINRPLGRPMYSSQQRRPMQGMSSPSQRPLIRRPSRIARPSPKAPNEINDVLKKLKDMGK